jgi:hypothetical protein
MDLTTQFKGGEMNTESPHPTYQAVVNGEHREYATKDSEWYFHAGWTWDGFKGQWYRKITEGEEMREKIALKVVKAIYMDRDSSQPMTDISLDIADQILSLPSGYIAGEHEITIEMALKMFGDIITDYPSYPHIGFYGGRRISHDRA